MLSRILLFYALFGVFFAERPLAQVTINYPKKYIVIQRNTQDEGTIYISGTLSQYADRVEARLLAVPGEATVSYNNWTTIDHQVGTGSFLGSLVAKGGRYDLEVRAMRNGQLVGQVATVEKVGVGEVFLLVGHSNAQGARDDGSPAVSSRVISMDNNSLPDYYDSYILTGDPSALPTEFSPLTSGHGIAPFGGKPWFWGRFGDLVVENLKVPVLLYQAAFGGSNMDQTEKSTRGEFFEHGFIRAQIRMPYINIENTLFHLVPKTGLRAILSGHGVNDVESSENEFYNDYRAVIEYTRREAQLRDLTWMVARSAYRNGDLQHLLNAQERLLSLDNVFKGADLNSIREYGRYDGLHFDLNGIELAAQRWSEVVSASAFRAGSRPLMPKQPEKPQGALPVRLVDFKARKTDAADVELNWVTVGEHNNRHFEIQYSGNGTEYETKGVVEGHGNVTGRLDYRYVLKGPFAGDNIYVRLKQVDFDGTFEYSNALSIKNTKDVFNAFSPNPSSGVFRFMASDGQIPELISVYDLVGVLKYEVRNTNLVDLTAFPAAAYIAIVEDKEGIRHVKRIVKL